MKDFTRKRCLITGAASGIGRSTAIAMAELGAELILTDIQEQALCDVTNEITASGGVVLFTKALDIADYDQVAEFGKEVFTQVGSMDVVMNIAGISAWGTVENLEHRHWQKMIDVNLMGPIHVIETFIPPMIEAGRGGHLVNVSSAAGLLALPWHAAYSASKFGLRGVSDVLRFDLRRHNIDVSLVCPGAVKTPLVNTVEIVGVDRDDPNVQKWVSRFHKKAVKPEKVAKAIITGMRKRNYLVYSSLDIRVGYWFLRKFALPYETVMRIGNKHFGKLLDEQKKEHD